MSEYNIYTEYCLATPRNQRKAIQAEGGGSILVAISSDQSVLVGDGHTHENKTDLDRLLVGTEDDYVRIRRWDETAEGGGGVVQKKAFAGYADNAGYAERSKDSDHALESDHAKAADEWLRRAEWLDQPVRTTDRPVFRGITVKADTEEVVNHGELNTFLRVESSATENLATDDLVEENFSVTGFSTAVLEVAPTRNTIGELFNVTETADVAQDGAMLVMRGGMWTPELFSQGARRVNLNAEPAELWNLFSSDVNGRFIGYLGMKQYELSVSRQPGRIEICYSGEQETDIIVLRGNSEGVISRSDEFIEYVYLTN